MHITIEFIRAFMLGLWYLSPLLIPLLAAIVAAGQILGKIEKWSEVDALYFTFITSLTIGYGDLRPTIKRTKLLAIGIGLLGLILNGIIVAITLQSVSIAFTPP